MSTAPSPEVPQHYLGGIALRLLAMLSLSLMFVLVKRIDAAGIHIVESLFWRQAIVLPMLCKLGFRPEPSGDNNVGIDRAIPLRAAPRYG